MSQNENIKGDAISIPKGLMAGSHREINRQFREREVSKCYLALAYGRIEQDTGTVNLPLIKDCLNRPKKKLVLSKEKKLLLIGKY
ncbi:Ribosomal large subunit pseudouridine synthase A (plasmid) [Piscirickettsia salmonis]|uniref:hypothetical protein n=1 Tax=Piscirickettsia salmonis TaxID=1238 RepID=UPI001E2A29F3|nr:hypothetical protein [Piscirickettsia salmonis]QGP52078.1 Ribosomal large subunit pseudouridine synthase A [Piscirickettsia salmonis]